MFEEAISLLSIWASMNSWLTPTVLFLLLNLMIGTIAVTSGFTSHKPNHHHNHPEPLFHHPHLQQAQIQPQLTRSPSVLQRIKSINFSTFYSQSPITHFQQPPPQQPDPTPEPEPAFEVESNSSTSEDDENPTLDEIYSRIKQGNSNPHYGRQNSDTKPSGGEIPVKLPQKMKKSASDKSAFQHFQFQESEAENEGVNFTPVETVKEDFEEERENAAATVMMVKEEREDEGVDAKADDFINRFRKQLQLQRKDSILRYKESISRSFAQ